MGTETPPPGTPPAGAPPPATPAAHAPDPAQWVPYARFAEVLGERNTFETKARERDAFEQRLQAAEATWSQERDLMQAGLLDEEGRGVARYLYGQIPETERPKTIKEWLAVVKADPTKAPRALAGYLGAGAPAAGAPGTPPAGQPPAPVQMPRTEVAGTQPPAAGQVWTAEAVRALKDEAVRTGDWSKYKAAQPAILTQIATSSRGRRR